MRFICDKCKAKYSIADEKINKKVLKIRCKKCSHVIIVRDSSQQSSASFTQLSASSTPQAPAHAAQHNSSTPQNAFAARPSQTHSAQTPQAQPQRSNAQAHIANLGPAHHEESDVGERTVVARISSEWFNQIREEKKEEPIWFVASQGQPVGPIIISDVAARIRNRELSRDELVWCAGWPDWAPAGTVNELQGFFASLVAAPAPPPPPPIRAPKPAPAPIAAPKPAPAAQPFQAQQANPFQAQAQAQQKSNPFQAQQKSNPFQAQAQTPQANPFQAPQRAATQPTPQANPFATANGSNGSNGSHGKQSIAFGPGASNPFESSQPSRDLGIPKPAASNPFGAPSSMPASANNNSSNNSSNNSPLAMLAEPAPAEPNNPTTSPWETRGQGQTLQTASSPRRKTPAELLTAAPAPQPVLSELTARPATPSAKPKNDIAHIQQARPAVELIEVSAEENFFNNAAPRKTDDDLFEVALPPLPNWEQDAHEIDADDIIEIHDAIRPRWGLRLGIMGGVIAAISIFVVTISWLFGGFKETTQAIASNTGTDEPKNGPSVTPRHVSRVGGALLGQSDTPGIQPNPTKKTRRYGRRKRPYRRRTKAYKVAARVTKAVNPTKPSDNGVTDVLRQAYLDAQKKMNGDSSDSTNSNPTKRSVGGKIQGGDKLAPSLEKRIYKEIARNRGQVTYCYEQYLKKAYLSGRLLIQIRIEPNGQVSNVTILSRKFRRLKISQCIARKMKRWRFASFSGTPYIDTEIPYLLKAQ